MQNLVMGCMSTQLIGVAAGLGVFRLLGQGPADVSGIAEVAKVPVAQGTRLMRALVSLGVVQEVGNQKKNILIV